MGHYIRSYSIKVVDLKVKVHFWVIKHSLLTLQLTAMWPTCTFQEDITYNLTLQFEFLGEEGTKWRKFDTCSPPLDKLNTKLIQIQLNRILLLIYFTNNSIKCCLKGEVICTALYILTRLNCVILVILLPSFKILFARSWSCCCNI